MDSLATLAPDARLAGRTALVTGASAGIGRAIALSLALHGAAVHAVARRRDELAALAQGHDHLHAAACDLTDDSALDRLAGALPGLDVLIHCAGAYAGGPLASTPVDILDLMYRANVRAPYLLTQKLLPLLRRKGGDLVFVNSSITRSVSGGRCQFAASQQALKAIADSVREEENGNNIRVLSIYPGRTATPRQESIHRAEGTTYRPERLIQADDVAAAVVHALLAPRSAEVMDIYLRPMAKPGAE
jgi:NADP-dependent 3-hydroxy acid dehydrogenase YdfG